MKFYLEPTEKVFSAVESSEKGLTSAEAEQRLAGRSFVRISNGEIVNLKKVRGFDLSFTGTICVSLANGTVSYVSRRYVSKIKQLLGL